MLGVLLGSFLIAHGLVHAAIWLPQAFGVNATLDPTAPFDPGHSWLLQSVSDGGLRWLSVGMALVATLGFVVAGVGLFAHQELWRPLTIGTCVISLALFLVYFTPWLSAAVLIDAALLLALLVAHWPAAAQVGA